MPDEKEQTPLDIEVESLKRAKLDPLGRNRVSTADHAYRQWNAIVPAQTPREVLCNPQFWMHVSPRINQGDEIRVLSDDMAMRAELICTHSDGRRIRLMELSYRELEENRYDIPDNPDDPIFVDQRPDKKWCVIQRSDGTILSEGHPNRTAALKQKVEFDELLQTG